MVIKIMKKFICFLLLLFYFEKLFAACSINIENLNFGTYNPVQSGDNLSSANLSINCLPHMYYVIYSNSGSSGSFTDRQMRGGNKNLEILHYNLYTNTNRTNIFGDGTNGTSYVSGLLLNTVTLFAKIPQLQNISAGNYTDNITINLNF